AGSVDLQSVSGGILSMVDGALGTLNVQGAGGIASTGSAFNFDVGATGTDRINVSNAVFATGSNTINLAALGNLTSSASPVSYTLMSTPPSSFIGGSTFVFGTVTGTNVTDGAVGGTNKTITIGVTKYNLSLSNSNAGLFLNVSQVPFPTWTGTNSTTWS